MKTTLVAEICWAVVIWSVKYSILAFYWRLFGDRSRSVRIITLTIAASVTCWGVTVVRLPPDAHARLYLSNVLVD